LNEMLTIIAIAGALGVGTMSPGPSFVMIARTAVAGGRAQGIAAAFGMGLGGVIFAAGALLGLQSLLRSIPTLYLLLKILGGLYLAYLGVRIWLGAKQPLNLELSERANSAGGWVRALLLGLATQLSNPKTAIVYASVFAALLPATVSSDFVVGLVALVFAIETSWYMLVALSLSTATSRAAYLRYKSWIDRLAGGVMVLLGLKLSASAGSEGF
jgi:threonine/homoserine/homoserine lactone efflux protein